MMHVTQPWLRWIWAALLALHLFAVGSLHPRSSIHFQNTRFADLIVTFHIVPIYASQRLVLV